MRNFEFRREYENLLTPDIVDLIAQIHEYKGQQKLFIEANQDALSELLEIAKFRVRRHLIELKELSLRKTG